VFWQDPQDAIANSLFKTRQVHGIAASPVPKVLGGVDQNPNLKTPPGMSLKNAASWLLSTAWRNKDTVVSSIGKVAAMLMDPPED